MNRIATLLGTVAITSVLLAASGCKTTAKSDATALEGKWSGREPGNSPETPREIVFSGSHLDYHGANPADWAKGTFTLKDNTQPRQLLLHLTDCGMSEYTGKNVLMIYKLENDTLTASAYEPGNASAPADFNDQGARCMIFKKAR